MIKKLQTRLRKAEEATNLVATQNRQLKSAMEVLNNNLESLKAENVSLTRLVCLYAEKMSRAGLITQAEIDGLGVSLKLMDLDRATGCVVEKQGGLFVAKA